MQEHTRLHRERILAAPYSICIERARYYTHSFRATEGEHPAIRAAKAFAHTLDNMSIYILDEEKIAGNRASKPLAVVIPVERGDINSVLELDLDLLTGREQNPFHITEKDKQELFEEILPYWRGRTLADRKKTLFKENGLYFSLAMDPVSLYRRRKSLDMRKIWNFLKTQRSIPKKVDYALKGSEGLLFNNPALLTNVFDTQGHLILGHKNILQKGFHGIKEEAETAIDESDRESLAFYKAVIISCEAMQRFAERYATMADQLAQESADADRREELKRIAAQCRHVPYYPPRTFHEAVQAMWLTQVAAHVSYGTVGIFATGRIDQHLYPYFAADKAERNITDAEAIASLEELLLKLSCGMLLIPMVGKNTGSEMGSDIASPTIGGLNRRGEDAVNEVSYLVLNAFNNIKSMANSFTIRLSNQNPPEFWHKALKTYCYTSGAALYNDEITVKALQQCGYSREDAHDYGVIGCVEPTGDGDTFGCTSGNDLSIVAALEMALLDGHLHIMGKKIGPSTGNPRTFKSFTEFWEAFQKQLSFLIRVVARGVNLKDEAYREGFPNPYVSSTLSGCLENGRDMTAGGAKYNFESIGGRGIGTTVDSLVAIKYFVYDRQEISMDQLLRALERNFKGEEKMRSILETKGPKYGCGNDYADDLAREVTEYFCREVSSQINIHGKPFRPGFFSYGMHVLDGLLLGATPNGRRAGEPISNSFSPSNGSELNGPTGVLRSVAANDHTLISNGCALNLRLSPYMFREEEQVDKSRALVQSFFNMGGMEIQFNVVDNATLREAQQNPASYRDLVVRVSGYSAFFTDLGRPLQDEIISRTEFTSF